MRNLARQVSPSVHITLQSTFNTRKHTINLPNLETLLKHCKSLKHFKQILSQMISTSFIGDTYAASKLLKFSTEKQFVTLNYSSGIFGCIQEPNGFICNTMMRAHLQRNSLFEVTKLYRMMLANYVAPDKFTYPILIHSCALQVSCFTGKQVHCHVSKLGFDSDVYVNNTLISMYAACDNISCARQVFDESPILDSVTWNSILAAYIRRGDTEMAKWIYNLMPEMNVVASNSMIASFGKLGCLTEAETLFEEMPEKDMVSWTALISCYEQNGMYLKALAVFDEMRSIGSSTDEVVIVSLLSACAHLVAIEKGELIHALTIKSGMDSYVNLQNACIHMYCFCGDMVSAKILFDTSVELDLISRNSMLSGYMRGGFIDEAQTLFNSMPEKDVVSWSAMISGYTKYGQFLDALVLFEKMKLANVTPDQITLASVMSACTHMAAFDRGKQVHDYIRKNGLKIDQVLGTSLIDMYMKTGSVEDAMKVFDNLEEKGVSTWNSTILGLSVNGMADKALQMFDRMKSYGETPNAITFTGVLGACRHAGLVDEGRAYYNSMVQEHNLCPNVRHYGCMVDLLGRVGLLKEAEELIMSMPMVPDVATWGALLGACQNHGDYNMGERLGKKLIELEPEHDGFHVLLADVHASKGNWEDVVEIRRQMNHRVAKCPGCSVIEEGNSTQKETE